MGWFGNNRNRDDSSKSTRKEPVTGKYRRDNSSVPQPLESLTNPSYVNQTQTATTNPDYDTSAKVQTDYTNTQEYSDDVEDQRLDITPSMGADAERQTSDDEDVVNDKRRGDGYHGEETVNGQSRSYSQAEETEVEEPVYNDVVKQNHLNSLFNGHLMKWKFEAEEGSGFIRLPAFLGALSLIGTAIAAVVMYPEAWEAHSLVMTVCVVIMSTFIAVLEGRFLSLDPLSARAHLRNVMTRNFNILRFLWGRGLLYISAGVLNVAQTWLITVISGAFMIALGLLAFIVGVRASRKFAALRNSLADESFLLLVFTNYDGDGDGYLKPYEFALLLSSLGMELDDRYTLKAFTAIDTDKNRKISFEELHQWWTSGYVERGRRVVNEAVGDEESYRRMD